MCELCFVACVCLSLLWMLSLLPVLPPPLFLPLQTLPGHPCPMPCTPCRALSPLCLGLGGTVPPCFLQQQ